MRDIAEFLLRYSVVLRRQGDLDGAKTAAEESVSFYRRLVKTPGFDYKAELKEALKNLSEILAQGAKRTMEEASAL
ncbi:hypothetical protein FRC02_012504 [Tulasnella sp. 418]|nr:hypothetical protein FRC02_012504 [Tulasnella sp. 418]